MYGEHSDGGMTEIESRDVNCIEDDFPIISEAKQDLQLYELQKLVVCCLKCSIYDIKQASRQWYFKFHKAIILIGFEMMKEDHCVYVK